MRTKQALINSVVSVSGQIIITLIKFINRYYFIKMLGKTYLGVNGLFTDLLGALSLIELGIGPAMAFSLYKPLAIDNKEEIKALMNMFKKAYTIVGVIFIGIGILFVPIYPFFIKTLPHISNLNLIFLLFVINTGLSYFYSYKRTLLQSDQKKYLDVVWHTVITMLSTVVQISILISTQNYILYLVTQIVATWGENYILAKVALKYYPYLSEMDIKPLSQKIKKEIKINVGAMLFHRIGGMVRTSTDNLLISKFLGLAVTGAYSNYSLMINSISNLFSQIFSAILSTVGHFHVTETPERQEKLFYKINYINFVLASFVSICFFALVNQFMLIWVGKQYIFKVIVVFWMVLRFYLDMMRKTPWMFCEAAGIYWQGKTKPIWEGMVNLVFSIILVSNFGIVGIFVGTVVSIILIDLTIEPHLVFKYILKSNKRVYYMKYTFYLLVMLTGGFLISEIIIIIPFKGIVGFLIKAICCMVLTLLYLLFTTFFTNEFGELVKTFRNTLKDFTK